MQKRHKDIQAGGWGKGTKKEKRVVHSMECEPWPDINWVTYPDLGVSLPGGKYVVYCTTKTAECMLQPLDQQEGWLTSCFQSGAF